MNVRVRYAPSPTGKQHIGGVRTALFNYFFARANKGTFILRVEDTDRERSTPEALNDILSILEWLGIDYDEGPGKKDDSVSYFQSERKDIYQEKAAELLSNGHAYPCFCTSERLDALRKEQKASKKDIGYDRHCRSLPKEEALRRIEAGESYVYRLAIPLEGKTEFEDFLLGTTGRRNRDINPDPVIMKTDGYPTYHLANVIDDHLMGITHVLRAQEWIPSGPLHALIYQAFGWNPPVYCHLPMVMGKDGQKLSKRHGSTAAAELREEGYLSDAIINYVALLGWSFDDSREFFSMEELCRLFSLERINKSAAVFDYKKLDWFNGHYIRSQPPVELKTRIRMALTKEGLIGNPPESREETLLEQSVLLVRERLKKFSEAPGLLRFLFCDPGVGDASDAIPKGLDAAAAVERLKAGKEILRKISLPALNGEPASGEWDEAAETAFREAAERMDIKVGSLLQPLRVAVTASRVSPPLFPSIRLLGLKESLRRADRLIEALKEK